MRCLPVEVEVHGFELDESPEKLNGQRRELVVGQEDRVQARRAHEQAPRDSAQVVVGQTQRVQARAVVQGVLLDAVEMFKHKVMSAHF